MDSCFHQFLMTSLVHVMENFWLKPVWRIHQASLKRKKKFEIIMEIHDKIEKNVDDMEIDELDDPDEQYQEIDTDNEGESKTEDDVRDDTNPLVTEEEEVGEDNLQEGQIEENELKESIKQKIVKDINVKTIKITSKILSSLHK